MLDDSIIFYLLKGIFDRLGDEFLTRHSLKTQSAAPQDDDIPHPLKVNNFAAGIDVGQISGKEMINTSYLTDHTSVLPSNWNLDKIFDLTGQLGQLHMAKKKF